MSGDTSLRMEAARSEDKRACSAGRALDALLTLAAALAPDSPEASQTGAAEAVGAREQRLALCRLLDCQSVGLALLDPEAAELHPLIVIGISSECEQQRQQSLEGMRLSEVPGEPGLLARLQAGEVVLFNGVFSALKDQPTYNLIAPILTEGLLSGVVFVGFGSVKPALTPQKRDLIKALVRLATFVVERERALHECDQLGMALKAAREALERVEQMKNSFLSIMSHEFRPALSGIQGFSEIMRDGDLNTMELKEFAVDIYAEARHLVRMVGDMLDLNRIETGHAQLYRGWLDLNAILVDACERVRASAPDHVFRLQLATALPVLRGDREKLSSVVTGLLDGAVKRLPAGGEIGVSSMVEGHVVHVSVSDQGAGIPIGELERLFEATECVRDGRACGPSGTGATLSEAREIIWRHGGQIWVESVPGQESIFHFTVQFTSLHYPESGL